jgi:hypothetical protein
MNHNEEPELEPIQPHENPTPAEMFESTKRLVGNLAPFLSFGMAQQEALTRAAIIDGSVTYEQTVHYANRHLNSNDPAIDAVAVVHAGMTFVGILRAGVSPANAGICTVEALHGLLGLEDGLGSTEVGF